MLNYLIHLDEQLCALRNFCHHVWLLPNVVAAMFAEKCAVAADAHAIVDTHDLELATVFLAQVSRVFTRGLNRGLTWLDWGDALLLLLGLVFLGQFYEGKVLGKHRVDRTLLPVRFSKKHKRLTDTPGT